jgi:hypothetical protein
MKVQSTVIFEGCGALHLIGGQNLNFYKYFAALQLTIHIKNSSILQTSNVSNVEFKKRLQRSRKSVKYLISKNLTTSEKSNIHGTFSIRKLIRVK